MAAPFSIPSTKKLTTDFPPRRGKIKDQIFKEIAKSVASAASRASNVLGLVKKDNDRAPETPPEGVTTSGDWWWRWWMKGCVMMHEKDPWFLKGIISICKYSKYMNMIYSIVVVNILIWYMVLLKLDKRCLCDFRCFNFNFCYIIDEMKNIQTISTAK